MPRARQGMAWILAAGVLVLAAFVVMSAPAPGGPGRVALPPTPTMREPSGHGSVPTTWRPKEGHLTTGTIPSDGVTISSPPRRAGGPPIALPPVLTALLVLVLIGALLVLRQMARRGGGRRWGGRWRGRHSSAVTGEPLSEDPLTDRRADIAGRLGRDAVARRRLLEGDDPRCGVLRAWLDVQEAAARSGMARRGSETSGEFTARVLGRWDVDPAALATLSGAYREAQFSDHPVSEAVRRRVVAALERIELGLQDPAAPSAPVSVGRR